MVVTSRRELFQLGLAAAVAAGPLALPQRVLAAPRSARLSRSMFVPHVGTTFTVSADRSYQAVLRAIDDLPHSPAGDPYRFGLLFAMSGGPEQGTYVVRNRSLSQLLFLVPVGGGRSAYEAVIAS